MRRPRQNARQVEFFVGNEWKSDGVALGALRSEDPLIHLRDVVDVVVDGVNLTRSIGEDRVVCLCADLLSGVEAVLSGSVEKSIVAYPEEPWEFTFQQVGEHVEMSLYNLGPSCDVLARNRALSGRELLTALSQTCRTLLHDLHSVWPELRETSPPLRRFEGDVERVTQRLHEVTLQRRGPLRSPTPGPLEPLLEHGTEDLHVSVRAATGDVDFLNYRGVQSFDRHALLLDGEVILTRGSTSWTLRSQGGLWSLLLRMLAVVRRALEWPGASKRSTDWGGVQVCVGAESTRFGEEGEGLEVNHRQLFPLWCETLLELEPRLLALNPAQAHNQRFLELFGEARRLYAWQADHWRSGAWSAVTGERVSADALTTEDPSTLPASVAFPYPEVALHQLKRLRVEAAWRLERPWIGFSEMCLLGDRLLVPCLNGLECVDVHTGGVLWRRAASPEDTVATRGMSASQVRSSSDALLLIGTGERHLSAVDATTGDERWCREQEHGELVGFGLQGSVAFLATDNGTLEALHAWSGEVLWRVSRRFLYPFGPLVHQDVVLMLGESPLEGGSCLEAFESLSGHLLWQRSVSDSVTHAPLVLGDRVVVMVESDEGLSWMAFCMATGDRLWTLPSPFGVFDGVSELVWQGEGLRFYALSDTGMLCLVDGERGRLVWSCAVDAEQRLSTSHGLHRAGEVLMVFHRGAQLVDPERGHRLCRIEGLVSEPAVALTGPRFELIQGEEWEQGSDQLVAYRTGHFLALLK